MRDPNPWRLGIFLELRFCKEILTNNATWFFWSLDDEGDFDFAFTRSVRGNWSEAYCRWSLVRLLYTFTNTFFNSVSIHWLSTLGIYLLMLINGPYYTSLCLSSDFFTNAEPCLYLWTTSIWSRSAQIYPLSNEAHQLNYITSIIKYDDRNPFCLSVHIIT